MHLSQKVIRETDGLLAKSFLIAIDSPDTPNTADYQNKKLRRFIFCAEQRSE
jgi:hypothetical protein